MRKRSEVAGSTEQSLPGQMPAFYSCCGLTQSAALAKAGCLKCGKPIAGAPVEEARQVVQQKTESQLSVPPTKSLEERALSEETGAVTAEELAAEVKKAKAAEKDPWQLKPERAVNLLIAALAENGFDVRLPQAAAWSLADRKLAWDWVDSQFQDKAPEFIKAYWKGNTNPLVLPLPKLPAFVNNPAMAAASSLADVDDCVEFVWAEETITPVVGSFSSTKIGPFTARTFVREGESFEQAYARLSGQVIAMAERERDRKVASFIAKVKGVHAEMRS